ncbi:MAG: hypothetical protein ABR606_20125 [Vicinamibacterales bacterium]
MESYDAPTSSGAGTSPAGHPARIGPSHPDVTRARRQLGNLLVADRRFAEAEPLLLAVSAANEKRLGRKHATTKAMAADLLALYEAWGRSDESAQWRLRAEGR